MFKKLLIISFFIFFLIIPLTNAETQCSYSASTETCCSDGKCTLTLYSGTMFTEELYGWHTLPEVSQIKWESGGFNFTYRDYWVLIEPLVIYNGNEYTIQQINKRFLNVNLKDHVSFTRFNHKFAANITAPQNLINNMDYIVLHLKDSQGLTWSDVKKTGNHSIVIKNKIEINYYDLIESHFTLNIVNKSYFLIGNISANSQNGYIWLDPTIKLQDADSENLDDASGRRGYGDCNNGINTQPIGGSHPTTLNRQGRFHVKFNITVPSGQQIDSATLYLYESHHPANGDLSSFHLLNHSWNEGDFVWTDVGTQDKTRNLTWNNQPCGTGFDDSTQCNLTISDTFSTTGTGWDSWDVTNAVNREYTDGDKNVSFVVTNGTPGVTSDYHGFDSKEGTTVSQRPYLNITYSVAPDTTPPTYSLNSTNGTIAGTVISHNLKWTDETGLATTGGYIFSFDNCTGTLTNDTWTAFSTNPDWSNVTKTINSTVGCTIKWCAYANDTSNNWNGTSCVTPFSYVTASAAQEYSRNVSDTSSVGDIHSGLSEFERFQSDSSTPSDIKLGLREISRPLLDSLTLGDLSLFLRELKRMFSDSLTVNFIGTFYREFVRYSLDATQIVSKMAYTVFSELITYGGSETPFGVPIAEIPKQIIEKIEPIVRRISEEPRMINYSMYIGLGLIMIAVVYHERDSLRYSNLKEGYEDFKDKIRIKKPSSRSPY